MVVDEICLVGNNVEKRETRFHFFFFSLSKLVVRELGGKLAGAAAAWLYAADNAYSK